MSVLSQDLPEWKALIIFLPGVGMVLKVFCCLFLFVLFSGGRGVLYKAEQWRLKVNSG